MVVAYSGAKEGEDPGKLIQDPRKVVGCGAREWQEGDAILAASVGHDAHRESCLLIITDDRQSDVLEIDVNFDAVGPCDTVRDPVYESPHPLLQ